MRVNIPAVTLGAKESATKEPALLVSKGKIDNENQPLYSYPMRADLSPPDAVIGPIKDVLSDLRYQGKVLLAVLYGSYAKGAPHARSDIDIAVYLNAGNSEEEMDVIDAILMASNKEISILRLDDSDESPFIVQEALRGVHLVEPDKDTLYRVVDRTLHESESLRFRRSNRHG